MKTFEQYMEEENEGTNVSPARPVGFSNERWAELLDSTYAQIKSLAATKGREYSGETDRLANFRRNALALGLTKEQVLMVYAGKHWDSLNQFVKDLSSSHAMPAQSEPITGRIDDLIVYLLLFKAMVVE